MVDAFNKVTINNEVGLSNEEKDAFRSVKVRVRQAIGNYILAEDWENAEDFTKLSNEIISFLLTCANQMLVKDARYWSNETFSYFFAAFIGYLYGSDQKEVAKILAKKKDALKKLSREYGNGIFGTPQDQDNFVCRPDPNIYPGYKPCLLVEIFQYNQSYEIDADFIKNLNRDALQSRRIFSNEHFIIGIMVVFLILLHLLLQALSDTAGGFKRDVLQLLMASKNSDDISYALSTYFCYNINSNGKRKSRMTFGYALLHIVHRVVILLAHMACFCIGAYSYTVGGLENGFIGWGYEELIKLINSDESSSFYPEVLCIERTTSQTYQEITIALDCQYQFFTHTILCAYVVYIGSVCGIVVTTFSILRTFYTLDCSFGGPKALFVAHDMSVPYEAMKEDINICLDTDLLFIIHNLPHEVQHDICVFMTSEKKTKMAINIY
ncbi:unnamed protein product [Bursaphelenchus xylophilus]|uniref:(pine wood nematode) hypothetical protein n=1 Tax=Bursaphelenchus xylophilus TaxID=6326 RepID=A0A1I7SV31_BURXY|nr:unnamed protein product [Bursaphelenchus xylophilus]CAG9100819.1 unnamed protein product [Bursaphelenchus xylophilus]